ncbi:MAG: Gldg family protein [Kiritimatiellaeota bacterium]|nr:Gldg family protein [Kiritimatiellota bacterium]
MDKTISNTERRRRKIRASLTLSIILATLVLIVANFCSSMFYARWRFVGRTELSKRSAEFISTATGALKISAVFEASHPFKRDAFDMLDLFAEAAARNSALRLETRKLDPSLDITECAELFRKIPAMSVNSFVIESGSRWQIVGEDDLSEDACVSAMIPLLRATRPKIYFTEGCGEYDPQNENRTSGASAIASALELNGYAVRKINPAAQSVPADCEALVIAGPKILFSPVAVEATLAYAQSGGGVFLLFDEPAASGFAAALAVRGIGVDHEALSDKPVRASADNGIVMTGNTALFFSAPLPLTFDEAEAVRSRSSIKTLVSAQEPENAAIAFAIESPARAEKPRRAESRIVVCGDSDFISNARIWGGAEGNAVFFLSCVNWLSGGVAGSPNHPAVSANAPHRSTFHSGIDGNVAWRRLLLFSAVLYPALILAFGLFIYVPWARR